MKQARLYEPPDEAPEGEPDEDRSTATPRPKKLHVHDRLECAICGEGYCRSCDQYHREACLDAKKP